MRFPVRTLRARTVSLTCSALALAGLGALNACGADEADEQGAQTAAVPVGRESNETDTGSSLGAVGLDARATGLIDIRGVGDSSWSDTHEPTARAARFGEALDAMDKSGLSYRGDLSFLNWESVVGNGCRAFWAAHVPGSAYAFVSRAENLAQAYDRGFNIVGLSNNHTRDCNDVGGGVTGETSTVRAMQGLESGRTLLWAGVASSSAGRRVAKVQTFTVKGRAIRVAFGSLYNGRGACSPGTCREDAEALMASLRDASADLRILAIHSQGSQPGLVDIGVRFVREFGGDVVFGHGPHVWEPVRVVRKPDGRRGVVFESLGNFIHPGLAGQSRNLIGRVLLDPSTLAIKQVQAIPVSTSGGDARLGAVSATGLAANVNWTAASAIRGAFANVKSEFKPRNPAPIECPEGYAIRDVGSTGGRVCTDGTNAVGPFTKVMIDRCITWGGGTATCNSNRWALSLVLSARGTGVCPDGAALDARSGYCAEGVNAFGPFPASLVDTCIEKGGGEGACRNARWDLNFLRSLLGA